MMTKLDLQCEISGLAYDIEDFKAAIKLEMDTEKRKKLNCAIEEFKKRYVMLRAMLDNGEYEEDEEDDYEERAARWQMVDEDARVAEAYASCSGSY
jgi:hypothetical protein